MHAYALSLTHLIFESKPKISKNHTLRSFRKAIQSLELFEASENEYQSPSGKASGRMWKELVARTYYQSHGYSRLNPLTKLERITCIRFFAVYKETNRSHTLTSNPLTSMPLLPLIAPFASYLHMRRHTTCMLKEGICPTRIWKEISMMK